MEDPRLEAILNRLDSMERALDELRDRPAHGDRGSREGHQGHGCGCHGHGRPRHEHGCGCHGHGRPRHEHGCGCGCHEHDGPHREPGCRCERQEHACRCRERECNCRRHDSRGPESGQAFHEKRVVDLIVRLVTERVDELLWRHLREREEPVASQEQAHEGEGTTEE